MKTLRISVLTLALSLPACSFSFGGKKAESPAEEKKDAGKGGKEGSDDEPSAVPAGDAGAAPDKSPSSDGKSSSAKKPSEKKPPAKVAPQEEKPAERPKLSGGALAAHNAALKAYRSGDVDGAKAQFQKAIKEDKKAYESYVGLGLAEERSGSPSAAMNAYKQALAIVPDDEEAIVALATLMARQGNTDGALNFLKEKSQTSPNSAAVLGALGEVSSIKGNSVDAQRYAQEALKKDPSYKPAMVTLARDHYRGRRMDLALAVLGGILDGYDEANPPRDPKNGDARLLRGVIYAERGLRGPAMEDLKVAVASRPDLVEAHMLLAKYYLEAGSAKEAEPELVAGLRYDRKNVALHMMLGDAYRLLNKVGEAKKELEWVLAADPSQVGAHYNLGVLFLMSDSVPGLNKKQQLDQAINHLTTYKSKAPRGGPDDVDELIMRAQSQKMLLEDGGAS